MVHVHTCTVHVLYFFFLKHTRNYNQNKLFFIYKSSFKNILSCYIIQSFSSALIQFGHCSSHACQFFSSSHRLFCFVVRCNSCVWHVDIIFIFLYTCLCCVDVSHQATRRSVSYSASKLDFPPSSRTILSLPNYIEI